MNINRITKEKKIMAKKYAPNNYDQQQANIRKAKGNPNKNVHQKKNGSNYKGYAAWRSRQKSWKSSAQRTACPNG